MGIKKEKSKWQPEKGGLSSGWYMLHQELHEDS